jgi:ribosomal protein L37AE/L43A
VCGAVEDYPRTLLDLERRFATDPACRDYLVSLRWPDGVVCPRCGGRKVWATGRGLWHCHRCHHQASVTAGTVFQDTHLPLTVWFRIVWQITSQKTGASALGIQRILGLGSYKTAWTILHKLRRAMVRPGRDRLGGTVEVDETYVGAPEEGVIGRLTLEKTLVIVAAQADGRRIGRIRMARIPDLSKDSLHGFIARVVEPGSLVRTDGLSAYGGLAGYRHEPVVIRRSPETASELLPRVHRVVSLLKRWLQGTLHGRFGPDYLDYYLDEFTFRFNRRTSASRGKLFYRLLQQAVQVPPAPYQTIIAPPRVGGT